MLGLSCWSFMLIIGESFFGLLPNPLAFALLVGWFDACVDAVAHVVIILGALLIVTSDLQFQLVW
jgi:hypothetical protein